MESNFDFGGSDFGGDFEGGDFGGDSFDYGYDSGDFGESIDSGDLDITIDDAPDPGWDDLPSDSTFEETYSSDLPTDMPDEDEPAYEEITVDLVENASMDITNEDMLVDSDLDENSVDDVAEDEETADFPVQQGQIDVVDGGLGSDSEPSDLSTEESYGVTADVAENMNWVDVGGEEMPDDEELDVGVQDLKDDELVDDAADNMVDKVDTDEIVNIAPEDEIFLDDLAPNTIYEKNGYLYQTDELGRPVMVSGNLEIGEGVRTGQQTDIGKMGYEGDEGGHLVATRFDGPPDAFNIVPQNAELNRGEWKEMENEWAKALEDDRDVEVMISPRYDDDSIRPSAFDVTYWIDGEPFEKCFLNLAPAEMG